MKALTLQPYEATSVAIGLKSIECRDWKTKHRGPVLICASAGPWESGSICKHALCIVNLVDIQPFSEEHLEDAFMEEMPAGEGKEFYAWIFNGVIPIIPFEQESDAHLFEVDDEKIVCMLPEDSPVDFFKEHYEPLMRFGDEYVPEELQREVWEELLAEIEEEYEFWE